MPGGKQPFKEPEKYIGNYVIDKTIGQGTYGKVKLGFHLQTKEKVAIKVIDKATIENDRQVKRIQKEIRFLKLLNHPNIVKIYDVLETESHIFMVMEYASGGELFDYIVAHKRVKEKEARVFFRQIVSALDYCHTNSVIHRDLKPENLLLDDHKNIKIIDFGFSNTFQSNALLNTFCGSPFYAAPEMILGKRYEGPEVDLWSLGVILFALLCGHLPFDDDDVKELYRKISTASYTTPIYLTEQSKELISRMITVHPKKRATLEEVKRHPWVNEGFDGPPPNYIPPREPLEESNLDPDIVEKLVSFGHNKDDILKVAVENETNPARSTYYLVQEMYKREEEKFKKLRQEKLDAAGRSMDSLGAISEDGQEEGDEMPSITIPSSPSTASPGKKFDRILDDFSRPHHPSSLSSSSTPAISASASASPSTSSPLVGMPPLAAAAARGRRASTSVMSTADNRAPPLFPNKAGGDNRAPPLFPNKNQPKAGEPGSSGEAASPTTGEPSRQGGRRLSLPAVEYSKKRNSIIQASEGETLPGIPGKIRTLNGWFSVSTTSNKTPQEIIAEIKRVLDENDFPYEYDGSYLFVCEDSKKGTVAFEIEICKVNKLAIFGLHLKRVRGSIWSYKKVCNKLLAQMAL